MAAAKLWAVVGWVLVFIFSPVVAARAEDSPPANDFVFEASLRLRYEFVDWLEPQAPGTDPTYSFGHSKLQLGAKYNAPWMSAYVQGQYFQLYDLPDDGAGVGATYFSANDREHHPGDVVLRQAYLNLFSGPAAGTFGRFLYSNGMEGLSKHETVSLLRRKRVSERVIGPFDFTGGRSFDGVRLGWNEPGAGALDAAVFKPTQGGFATDASSEIEDVFLVTSAASLSPEIAGTADVQLFYYYYQDDRGFDVVKVDNRPLEVRKLDNEEIAIHNFGFHAIDVAETGGVQFDWLIWTLAQTGDWGRLDHSAVASAVEGGVKFKEVGGKPWLRIGWNWSTGDGDAGDGKHHTFFQMLPTARQYAETPFYNLMNNQEVFATLAGDICQGCVLKAGASYLWAAQEEDLLYAGGGATKETQFGYSGSALGESRDLGFLASLQGTYAFNAWLTLSAYYGHLFGQDALEAAFSRKDIDYGYLEASLKY